MTDRELIWISAFRYGLGRKTYIVSVICDWLKSHKLSKQAKELIIKEIEEAEEEDKLLEEKLPRRHFKLLGDECDKKRWLELKSILKEELK